MLRWCLKRVKHFEDTNVEYIAVISGFLFKKDSNLIFWLKTNSIFFAYFHIQSCNVWRPIANIFGFPFPVEKSAFFKRSESRVSKIKSTARINGFGRNKVSNQPPSKPPKPVWKFMFETFRVSCISLISRESGSKLIHTYMCHVTHTSQVFSKLRTPHLSIFTWPLEVPERAN